MVSHQRKPMTHAALPNHPADSELGASMEAPSTRHLPAKVPLKIRPFGRARVRYCKPLSTWPGQWRWEPTGSGNSQVCTSTSMGHKGKLGGTTSCHGTQRVPTSDA
ncbi:Hypothetical predicted protein [Pelobates cultripes]|uniref:Uncharacterized protein n=1 Tax=Pelobates cultripes TaxID=61616 RepID=A0AAD1R9K2_PELCU|nr:Hypothetical predicted protein [Pelobates cultripes]